MVPLLRDGHTVVGLDRAPAMLARAADKIAHLSPAQRARALLIRADLRRFAFRARFGFAVAAFHSIQHLVSDRDLVTFLRAVRRALEPGGWLAFDVFAPARSFLARDENRRWDRTPFRDPTTGKRLIYSISHHLIGGGAHFSCACTTCPSTSGAARLAPSTCDDCAIGSSRAAKSARSSSAPACV